MEFEWDTNKALTNFTKHGVTFSEAATVCSNTEDDLRPEYDFSGGVRGKHYQAYRQGTNLVPLDPDVARMFPDAAAVNEALRLLVKLDELVKNQGSTRSTNRT